MVFQTLRYALGQSQAHKLLTGQQEKKKKKLIICHWELA